MATPIPDNRAELSLADVLTATGGELLSGDRGAVVRGVTTDTRGDVKGKLFVALAGESFDGHEFVARAVRAGATAALVSRDFEVLGDVAVVRVADTLTALGDLAGFHRAMLHLPRLAWVRLVALCPGLAARGRKPPETHYLLIRLLSCQSRVRDCEISEIGKRVYVRQPNLSISIISSSLHNTRLGDHHL